MIHIITYQSIKGNDEQQIFEDFASALKLITSLQQNDYPFLYNSVATRRIAIPDFMKGYPQYRRRDTAERRRVLGQLSMDAFVANNNQTRLRKHAKYADLTVEFDIKNLGTDEAIAALELEKKISA
tara:strand:- start:43 stop:420 length:378 start_codon:yes stop_codon:yes gene_type:complete